MINITDKDIDEFEFEYNDTPKDQSYILKFDRARRNAITSWSDTQACPGSGKTTLIAAKLIILSKKWNHKYKGICVLTHTNVASDEIKSKILKHPNGHSLLSYPHFIGTIQEFINKFLGLPYLRSNDYEHIRVDDDICVGFMERQIAYGTRIRLEKKRGNLHSLKVDNSGEVSIPTFKKKSPSDSYKDLENVFLRRIAEGLFFYSEMYYFSNICMDENKSVISSLKDRFPFVLIDEMQDTQDFQDKVLDRVFGDGNTCLQRFGDPDQAIFDGIGGEKPNKSFNDNSMLTPILSTHRFEQTIADIIVGLSVTRISKIESFLEPTQSNHTIFIFDNESKSNTLNSFADLVAECNPENTWKTIKAIGAVEGTGGYISEYWNGFEKKISAKRTRPKKLIDVVYHKWWKHEPHGAIQYKNLINGVVELLRLNNNKDERFDPPKVFSSTTLKSWMIEKEKHTRFNKLLARWIDYQPITENEWYEQLKILLKLFDIKKCNSQATNYLVYEETSNEVSNDSDVNLSNIFKADCGIEIEVGTIHSAKGETHDATLVLETKFNQFDIKSLLNHLIEKDSNAISGPRKLKFARQLYVAMSRPRKLLCLAIHKDHISEGQINMLQKKGWKIAYVEPDKN